MYKLSIGELVYTVWRTRRAKIFARLMIKSALLGIVKVLISKEIA